jgi:hypothetical protein
MENSKGFNMPTEDIELPSKGLLYQSGSALASGVLQMRYMTAQQEDILTNINYIKNNTVFDKLVQSLLVTKINYDELLVADRDALLIAARILGYGGEYSFTYADQPVTVDLTELETKYLDDTQIVTAGQNEFQYQVPTTGTQLTFKLLTVGDEKLIEKDLAGYKKINPQASPELSTRLKTIITSVNGDTSKATVRDYVDNHFLARDSRAFRKHLKDITPGVELKFDLELDGYTEEGVSIPMDASFFWPES